MKKPTPLISAIAILLSGPLHADHLEEVISQANQARYFYTLRSDLFIYVIKIAETEQMWKANLDTPAAIKSLRSILDRVTSLEAKVRGTQVPKEMADEKKVLLSDCKTSIDIITKELNDD